MVPVFNERSTLPVVLERVARTPFDKEIVIVDDGSDDGTQAYLEEFEAGRKRLFDDQGRVVPAHVIRLVENAGKGAALRVAFERVRGSIVLIQDADLEYDPADYRALIEPIASGRADVVYGTRLLDRQRTSGRHALGNRFLTWLCNMLNDVELSDMETGFKVFRREVIDRLAPTLKSNRFGFEPEITVKVARAGYRIHETPIVYRARSHAAGKKITWRDGVAAVFHLIRFRFGD